MEVVKIKCPSCKADIEVAKEGMARCPYCGTGIYAERKDEKVIINTTINNYNMATPQTTVNSLGSLYRVIVIVGAVMIILFFAAKIYITSISNRNNAEVSEEEAFTPRTTVNSETMVKFMELVFQKPIENIGSDDYSKIKSIKFTDSFGISGFDKKCNIAYELDDGSIGEVNISKELINDTSVDFEDFQCFRNLQSLDISRVGDLNKEYGYTVGDSATLSNLTKLESFASNSFTYLEELENMFSDTKQIKELSINIYEGFDMEEFVDKFSNLEKLTFYYVDDDLDIKVLSSLSRLDKLESLAIPIVRDNAYLSSLVGLKKLELAGSTTFSDYSVLYGMPQLESLILNNADGLKSIDFVKNMSDLSYLYVDGSDINSIEVLSAKPIKTLILKDNEELKDYTSLLTLSELIELEVNLYYVEQSMNIPEFSSLGNLKKVSVSDNLLDKVTNNTLLEELSIDVGLTNEVSMESLANMSALSKLNLYGDGNVGDFAGIEKLTNLKSVKMQIGAYSDISPLFNLSSLDSIDIDTENAVHISPENIVDNPHLKELNLYEIKYMYKDSLDDRREIKIGDIAEILNKFTALERLIIRTQGISDLSFVQYMPDLSYIDISDNYVQDISPLVGLTNLKVVVCPKNQIANEQLLPDTVTVLK